MCLLNWENIQTERCIDVKAADWIWKHLFSVIWSRILDTDDSHWQAQNITEKNQQHSH